LPQCQAPYTWICAAFAGRPAKRDKTKRRKATLDNRRVIAPPSLEDWAIEKTYKPKAALMSKKNDA